MTRAFRAAARTARRWRMALSATLLTSTLLASACGTDEARGLEAEVLARHPHDTNAFTQGLVWHDGWLYESTGRYGASSLRRVDLESGEVRDIRYLGADLFAEGLAHVGDELIQLTWRAGVALRWPLEGFASGGPPLARHDYQGEGWGLCYDGTRLVMSDGSDRLTFRDPSTFEVRGSVAVTLDGEAVTDLNELECIGEQVWANVWYDDRVMRIDAATGRVTGVLDLSGLLGDEERAALSDDAVLNGIAWRPEEGELLVTGKDWPALFALRVEGLDAD
ncbi:MAG: glutaminyl-peptide cyclotransferase [Trueperaceae bacterium]|nr:glutaminyl-peptide cyclotransferase [Trueperaceae bacterium]